MTEFRRRIEKQFEDCLATKCEENKCELRINNSSKSLCSIIDCNLYKKNHSFSDKICDYILFYWSKRLGVVVLELKSGNIGPVGDCVEQLQNGILILSKIATPQEVPYCLPLLVHGSGPSNSTAIKALNNPGRRVSFRGKRLFIMIKKCGTYLSEVIQD